MKNDPNYPFDLAPHERLILQVLVDNRNSVVSQDCFEQAIGGWISREHLAYSVYRIRRVINGKIRSIRNFGYRYDG